MVTERLFADVLQGLCDAKKTGALFVSVTAKSENLVRFDFREGKIIRLNYGPINGRECLDVIDCYDFNKAVFLGSPRSPASASDLPDTKSICAQFQKNGMKVFW